MKEKSCGTVLFTRKGGKIMYLLTKAPDDGNCGFPKGHMEGNETEEETAYRETWEETSIRAEVDTGFRAETRYRLKNGNQKTVVYFVGEYRDQSPRHNEGFERLKYLLLPFEDARRALTFENAKDILTRANAYIQQKNEDRK